MNALCEDCGTREAVSFSWRGELCEDCLKRAEEEDYKEG